MFLWECQLCSNLTGVRPPLPVRYVVVPWDVLALPVGRVLDAVLVRHLEEARVRRLLVAHCACVG